MITLLRFYLLHISYWITHTVTQCRIVSHLNTVPSSPHITGSTFQGKLYWILKGYLSGLGVILLVIPDCWWELVVFKSRHFPVVRFVIPTSRNLELKMDFGNWFIQLKWRLWNRWYFQKFTQWTSRISDIKYNCLLSLCIHESILLY